jgi:RNA polymerase sigma-70 factor (sigma-E family)
VPLGELVDALREQAPASGQHRLRAALEPCRPGRGGQLLTGDYSYAEGLVQASMVKLSRAWPRLDTPTDLDAYLRRVIVKTRVSWWRQETPVDVLPEEAVSSHDPAERHVLGVPVRRSLARLPRRQRAVLVLRYCEDLPEAEVAALLSSSPGTVKSHAHRGLRALRELLGGEFPLPAVSEIATSSSNTQ